MAETICRTGVAYVGAGSENRMSFDPSIAAQEPVRVNGADEPPRFTSKHWGEVTTLPSSSPLVRDVINEGGMSVLYGESGCTKTFLAQGMALHVALGRDWFGCRVKQRSVLYIAAEGGDFSISARLLAFKAHHGLSDEGEFHYITEAPDLCSSGLDADAIIAEVMRLPDVGLVVIDTLSRVLAGGNENASDDMGALVNNCDRIRKATGAHVMIVHHAGKDGSRGARGHSLLRAATDTEIEIKRDEAFKISTATITKQRDGDSGKVFAYSLKVIEIGTDDDGDPITSCVVETEDAPASVKGGKKIVGQKGLALKVLRELIDEHGEPPPPSNQIPQIQTIKVVRANLWRTHFIKRNPSTSDKPDSISRAFRRAVTDLQNDDAIGVYEEVVWLK
jgi:AAA domain